jgi:hypothetical protein
MGMFKQSQPNDVLFLQPVRYASEKLPRGRIRMLYCDAEGKVFASVMSRSIYQLARDNAERMARCNKPFATVGLETAPGRFVPTTVVIGQSEAMALEHMLDHALKKGRIPDVLRRYIRPILQQGEGSREAVISTNKSSSRHSKPGVTPRVLNRLPYYPEHDIEVSMPLYKAEYSYPLVVLKRLPPDEQTPPNTQRMLILDSDGDLAVIKVPTRLIRRIEIELADYHCKGSRTDSILISRGKDGLETQYLPLSLKQKKALDTLITYYEETGTGKQPISTAARTVIAKAKEKVAVHTG